MKTKSLFYIVCLGFCAGLTRCGYDFSNVTEQLYSHDEWGDYRDFLTGIDFDIYIDNFQLQNTKIVESVTVQQNKKKDSNSDAIEASSIKEIYNYNDFGNVYLIDCNAYDPYPIKYEYDSDGRCIVKTMCGINSIHSYKYKSQKEREKYFDNELEENQKIEIHKDGYKIVETNNFGNITEREFFYKGNKLYRVKELSKPYRSDYISWDLKYTNGKLSFIEKLAEPDKIRSRIYITYNEAGFVNECRRELYENQQIEDTHNYKYSDYDNEGNWHKCTHYCNNEIVEIITRSIEYKVNQDNM